MICKLAVLTADLIDQRKHARGVGLGTLNRTNHSVRNTSGNIQSGVNGKFVAYVEFLDFGSAVKAVDSDGRLSAALVVAMPTVSTVIIMASTNNKLIIFFMLILLGIYFQTI